MSLRTAVRQALASADEVAAVEERTEAAGHRGCVPVADLADRRRASAAGVLRSVVLRPSEGVPTVEAELYDGSGSLDLIWLGRRTIAGIEPGRRVRVEGMICDVDGRRTVYNPRYELLAKVGE